MAIHPLLHRVNSNVLLPVSRDPLNFDYSSLVRAGADAEQRAAARALAAAKGVVTRGAAVQIAEESRRAALEAGVEMRSIRERLGRLNHQRCTIRMRATSESTRAANAELLRQLDEEEAELEQRLEELRLEGGDAQPHVRRGTRAGPDAVTQPDLSTMLRGLLAAGPSSAARAGPSSAARAGPSSAAGPSSTVHDASESDDEGAGDEGAPDGEGLGQSRSESEDESAGGSADDMRDDGLDPAEIEVPIHNTRSRARGAMR